MPGIKPTPSTAENPAPSATRLLPLEFRHQRLRSTLGAFLLMIGTSGATGMSFIILPASVDFAVPASTFLIYFSLFTLTGAASMGFSGKLAARFGIKKVIVAGGVLASAGMLGMSLAPNLSVLYCFAAAAGLGWGGCTVMASAVLVNGWHTHAKRGTVLGLVMAGTGPGGVAWGFIMPPLIAAAGWRGGVAAVAGACAVLMVLNGIFLISDPPSAAEHTSSAGKTVRKTAGIKAAGLLGVLALLVTGAFILAMEAPVYAVLPAIFATAGIVPGEAGALVAIFAFCLIFTPPILGFVNDKSGIYAMLAVTALAYMIALPLLALATSFVPAAVAVVVLSLAVSSATVVVPLVVGRAVGKERFSGIYGVIMMVSSLGMSLGAPLWGLSYDLTGKYTMALYIAILGAVLSLTLMGLAIRTGNKKRQMEPHDEVTELVGDGSEEAHKGIQRCCMHAAQETP